MSANYNIKYINELQEKLMKHIQSRLKDIETEKAIQMINDEFLINKFRAIYHGIYNFVEIKNNGKYYYKKGYSILVKDQIKQLENTYFYLLSNLNIDYYDEQQFEQDREDAVEAYLQGNGEEDDNGNLF